ncbi:MAG: hypothetical protein M3Y59_22080 [Myxococcota bacterium]|nr:hypothetical protein [Myxococcota bacterium]
MSAQRASQLVEAGVWLQATGDKEGAQRLFEQALKLDPENARARQFLGLKGGAAPASPAPAEQPLSGGTLIFANEGAPASTGTVLYGPGAVAPPAPRATPFDPPKPLPPPVDLDWGEATGAPAEQPGQPEWEFRTPLTPSKAAIRPDATSAWDSGTDPGVLVAAAAPPTRTSFKDPLDLVTAGIHTPLPMRMPSDSQIRHLKDELQTLLRGARDLQELDDHSGALDLLGKALELDPLHKEALALREKSEGTLLGSYESKLGGMEHYPSVILKQDEIIWLNLDHRAGFVLAQIDGTVTYDDLFAICGMSRLDTARILAQLVEEGVIRS